MSIDNIRIPNQLNISKPTLEKSNSKAEVDKSEFKKLFEKEISRKKVELSPIKFSSHASKRLEQRAIGIDQKEMQNLEKAFAGLASKGGKDSLVLTNKGAYVVDVPNRLVVTAMHKNGMDKNVFTNIDSTILVDG
jgi:flagellar operon protein